MVEISCEQKKLIRYMLENADADDMISELTLELTLASGEPSDLIRQMYEKEYEILLAITTK